MSTTKIKVIKEAIKRINKRLPKINEFLTANPMARVFEIRREAQSIMEKHEGDHTQIIKLIKPLAEEEKKLMALAKRQCASSSTKMIDEKVKLEVELMELNTELFYAEKRES